MAGTQAANPTDPGHRREAEVPTRLEVGLHQAHKACTRSWDIPGQSAADRDAHKHYSGRRHSADKCFVAGMD